MQDCIPSGRHFLLTLGVFVIYVHYSIHVQEKKSSAIKRHGYKKIALQVWPFFFITPLYVNLSRKKGAYIM